MIINCTVKELQEMLLLLKAKQEQSKELTGEDMLEGARKAFGYDTPKAIKDTGNVAQDR